MCNPLFPAPHPHVPRPLTRANRSDNLLYLTEIKFTTAFDKTSVKMKSYQLRLIAAVSAFVQVVLAVSKQQDAVDSLALSAGKSAEADEKFKKAREKQGSNVWKTIKNGADVITYLNSAELVKQLFGRSLDDGTVGVVGALSSYAGIVEIWQSKV